MSTSRPNLDRMRVGTSANDIIIGGDGNDTILGGDGNDILSGGNGRDTIDGGLGNDIIGGGNGDDILDGGAGSDWVFGDNGNDTATYTTLDNPNGADFYDGGNGLDTLVLKLTQAQLNEMNASTVFRDFHRIAGTNAPLDFSDYGFSFGLKLTVKGFEQIRTVVVADPNPPPVANADANAINEDGPSSTVAGNVLANDTDVGPALPGVSVVDAGVRIGQYGSLTLNADGSYCYVLNQTNAAVNALNDGDMLKEILSYTVTDGLHGNTADLTITINGHTDPAVFTAGNDVVDLNTLIVGTYQDGTQYDALAGDDTVILPRSAAAAATAGYVIGTAFHAGDGQNHVLGGALDDTIIGGGGVDTIDGGAGNDTLLGGTGDDSLIGGLGDDLIDGGGGRDLYTLAAATFVNLAAGTATGADGNHRLISIECVQGSPFNDVILGDDADNYLAGGAGNDRIDGGAGNDIVDGGLDDDILDGGAGINRVTYENTPTSVRVDLSVHAATNYDHSTPVGSFIDRIENFQEVVGSNFGDRLDGDDNDNSIFGLDGDDDISGGGGSDHLEGGLGRDQITGSFGNDTMAGGVGADVFHFDLTGGLNLGNDVITDFEIGIDRIEVVGSLHDNLAELNPEQVGQDTVLDLGYGTHLILLNTQASLLTDSDFHIFWL